MIKAEKIEECQNIVETKYLGASCRRTDRDPITWCDGKTGKEVAVLFEDFDHRIHFEFLDRGRSLKDLK